MRARFFVPTLLVVLLAVVTGAHSVASVAEGMQSDPCAGLPEGSPCDDANRCTAGETCQSGTCGAQGSCPAGFAPVPSGCRKVYDIDLTLLDNQPLFCDTTATNWYNGCIGDYGFHWTDAASGLRVIRIDAAFQAGISCNSSHGLPVVAQTSLNGAPVGSFQQSGTCNCDSTSATVTLSNVDRGPYRSDTTNNLAIEGPDCDGLSNDGPFGPGLFARVTVTYGSSNVDCDDGNPCTDDSCDAVLGCVHAPLADGAACEDGNRCTRTDTCQAGTCTGSNPVPCTASDSCHVAGTCDPATGSCSKPGAPNGTSCNDGNRCTQVDTCQGGTCTGSSPVTCVPSGACHVAGTCDPVTGTCSNPSAPNGTPCNDSNACTIGDACLSGSCVPGEQQRCAPPSTCQFPGTCDPSSGVCSYPPKPNGTLCSDGDACTLIDSCQSGTCKSGAPKTCTAPDACHDATCVPATGLCSFPPKPDGTACNDSNLCTVGDACLLGICRSGAPKTCVPLDGCHVAGACAPSTGICSNPNRANGTICDDGNPCTTGETCTNGACANSRRPKCSTGTVEADTMVRQASPGSNYNTSSTLDVGGNPERRILVRVKVSGSGPIARAILRLTPKTISGSAGSIHVVPCGWSETTVNWNSKPVLGPVLDTRGPVGVGQTVDFDVTSGIPAAGTYCFGIDDPQGTATYNARETLALAARPALLVEATCPCD